MSSNSENKSGPSGSKPLKRNKNGKKKPRNQSYKVHIARVLKQVHPNTHLSKKAMTIMNCFMEDMFERIATEAAFLAKHSQKVTMTSKDVEASVRLLLSGELAKHAVSVGTNALARYYRSTKQK